MTHIREEEDGGQRYEPFVQAGRLYRALIFLGLAPCVPSTSVFDLLAI